MRGRSAVDSRVLTEQHAMRVLSAVAMIQQRQCAGHRAYLHVRDDDLGLGHVAGALVALVAGQGPLAGEQRGEDQDEKDHEDGQQEVGSLAGLAFPARSQPFDAVGTGTMHRDVIAASTCD